MIKSLKKIAVFLVCLVFSVGSILACSNTNFSQSEYSKSNFDVIPRTFFGLHLHRVATTGTFQNDRYITKLTAWPPVPFATWRLITSYTEWLILQPQKDQWNFEILDKSLALAEANNVEPLLPLAIIPTWASARPKEPGTYGPGTAAEPKDIEYWRNYVRTVATRYKGRIRYYEIWNEANWEKFYTGSMEEMLKLCREAYQILKEIDPNIVVVSPSAANLAFMDNKGLLWLEEFLAAGGGKYADVIGYHFYIHVKPPEALVPVISQARKIMAKYGQGDKELWNTEAGWLSANLNLSDEEQAAYVARSFILNWDAGVSRFYWYSWDNLNNGVQMVEKDRETLTSAGIAYGEVYKWLVGASMMPCQTNSEKTWTCTLTGEGGDRSWIVWNPQKNLNFSIPQDWNINGVKDLTGASRKVQGVQIEIGPSPLLLKGTY